MGNICTNFQVVVVALAICSSVIAEFVL